MRFIYDILLIVIGIAVIAPVFNFLKKKFSLQKWLVRKSLKHIKARNKQLLSVFIAEVITRAIMVAGVLFLLNITFNSSEVTQKIARTAIDNNTFITLRGWLNISILLVWIIVISVIVQLFYSYLLRFFAVECINSFESDIHIIRPNITDEELYKLNRDWAIMVTTDDYYNIINRLDEIKKRIV